MRLFLWGLAIAAAIYLLSAGHVLFLPLLFFLPLGGMFGRRSRGYGRGGFGGGGLFSGGRGTRRW